VSTRWSVEEGFFFFTFPLPSSHHYLLPRQLFFPLLIHLPIFFLFFPTPCPSPPSLRLPASSPSGPLPFF